MVVGVIMLTLTSLDVSTAAHRLTDTDPADTAVERMMNTRSHNSKHACVTVALTISTETELLLVLLAVGPLTVSNTVGSSLP